MATMFFVGSDSKHSMGLGLGFLLTVKKNGTSTGKDGRCHFLFLFFLGLLCSAGVFMMIFLLRYHNTLGHVIFYSVYDSLAGRGVGNDICVRRYMSL